MKNISDLQLRRYSECLGVAVFLVTACISIRFSHSLGADFHAFYCAGSVVNENADPYRVEPLRTCESDTGIHAAPLRSGFVVPAPLPGYDIALFTFFARLPYPIAAFTWQICLWICVTITIFVLSRYAKTPPLIPAAVLLFSDGYISSLVGNMVPVAVTAITLAAWCASRRKYRITVFWVALSMCEPQIGLGSLAALAIFVPTARWSVAICTLALSALTYATTGIVWTSEYLRDVLPRQVLSEITSDGQYSLTHLLHLMGFSDSHVASLGEGFYLIALVVGIFLAGRWRASFHDDAFFVVIPPVFALIGSPYVHLIHMAIALPAAFLLYARSPQARRMLGWCIMLLAIPWTAFAALLLLPASLALVVAILAWSFIEKQRFAAIATVGQLLLLFLAMRVFHPNHVDLSGIVVTPSAFAEDAWRPVVDAWYTGHASFFLALQLPTWGGLVGIAWTAITTTVHAPKGTPILE